jgi:phosphoglucosamine mutase
MFGTDGIRGKWGSSIINEEVVIKVSQAILNLSKQRDYKKIVIGYDTRLSCRVIFNLIYKTFNENEIEVINCGYLPTNGVALITTKFKCFGVMITASHNEYSDNGLKIFDNNGIKISKELEEQITLLCQEIDIKSNQIIDSEIDSMFINQIYNNKYLNPIDFYFNSLLQNLPTENVKNHCKMNILIDFGNGAGFILRSNLENYLKKLNISLTVINYNPDGKNINYLCGSNHIESLKNITKDYDLLFAFDGDADRIVMMDCDGFLYNGDKIIAFLAKNLQSKSIVHTCMSNSALDDFLKSNFGYEVIDISEEQGDGGNYDKKIIITKVGDKNVFDAMEKSNALFGGEESGHIIIKPMKASDSIFVTLFILSILQKNIQKIIENDISLKTSDVIKKELKLFEDYPQISKSFYFDGNDSEILVGKIKKIISEYQGIRSVVRKSGTEPKLRIMIEGNNLSEQISREIFEKINKLF